MSHEVRNLCSALSVVSLNLKEKRGIPVDEETQAEFRAMESLVKGLEKIAAMGLPAASFM